MGLNIKDSRTTRRISGQRQKTAKVKVVLCCSHEFGAQLVLAFAYNWLLQALFEVVHVFTDNANGRPGSRPVWEYDSQFPEERQLVSNKVDECIAQGRFKPSTGCSNAQYSDEAMLKVLKDTGANCIISGTYHGIFGEDVLAQVLGLNFHPSAYRCDLDREIPPRYRGKSAGRAIIEDIASGASPGAVVGLHQLVRRVDAGTVFAWSELTSVTVPRLSKMTSQETQDRVWARRMSLFQKTLAPQVANLAVKALPYLIAGEGPRPDGVRSREELLLTTDVA